MNYAFSRNALKEGLLIKGFKNGDRIIMPHFICEAIIHVLDELNIKPVFYDIDRNFLPNWSQINNHQINFNCKGILMVHYFGQPQNIRDFRIFSSENNLILIEDNAHGHGGLIDGKLLSTFGDIGISSPRKLVNTFSGGILFIDGEIFQSNKTRRISILSFRFFFNILSFILPKFSLRIKNLIFRKNCNNLNDFKEDRVSFFMIDYISQIRIKLFDWHTESSKRRKNWNEWAEWAVDNNLEPFKMSPEQKSNPWALPIYFKNPQERERIFLFGKSKNIPFFPWPSLSTEVIKNHKESKERWKQMLCVNLDFPPSYWDL